MTDKNIIDFLIENKSKMAKKHQAICDYLLDNHSDISMMSVKELAAEVGVGTTTVLRFTQDLGYNSFFELKKEFFEIQKSYAYKWGTVQSSFEIESNELSEEIWNENIKVLDRTLTAQLLDSIHKAVNILVDSKHIYLTGSRPYRPLAMYMETLILEFEPRVNQLAMDTDSILDRTLLLDKEDAIVLISFSPYAKSMIDVAETAYEKGVPLILITDELSNPMSQYAKVILKVEASTKHFTVVSIISIIEALVVEYGSRLAPQSGENVEALASILEEKKYLIGEDTKTKFKE